MDALEIYGNPLSTNPLKYSFLYHDAPYDFPSRETFAQDFWGYFNGQIGNTTLIPYNIYFDEENWGFYQWKGAKRVPNFEFAKTGTLHTIIYPTGGKTEFEYQLHRINSIVPNYETSVQNVQRGFNSFTGGTSPNNTYNYCDDMVPTPPYPTGSDISFTIPTSGLHNIKFYAAGSQGSGSYVQFAALYKPEDGLPKDFCELFNAPTFAKYYGSFSNTTNVTTTAYLESGTYRILLLNSNPNVTINLEVWGKESIEELGDPYGVGGLRIKRIVDKDENNNITSKRLYYYGDLSSVSPASITESFVLSSNLNSGTLHHFPEFETSRPRLTFEPNGAEYTCYSTTRMSNSRVNSTLHVTYPVVSEIQFAGNNVFNGYTLFEFVNNYPDAYIDGYAKSTVLNGKLLRKQVHNSTGQLVSAEQSYYSQRSAGAGGSAFYFRHTPQITREDIYIKYQVGSPGQEFFHFGPMGFALGQEQHCHLSTPNQVIVSCRFYDGEWQKIGYTLPRYWVTTDSTRVLQYANSSYLETVTKNFYYNTNHYQITRTEFKDSKGINRKVELSYPHELQTAEPSNPAWPALVNANRIAERIQIKSTFASNQPDFLQKTEYKSITVDGNTVYVPDVTKLSSGTGPLESRIQIHQYDNAGNITEISKESDMRTAYRWGYNQTFPIAVVQHALASEIFHTSFEAGEENGNSADSDSRTGIKSKTGGYSKLVTGLTPNKSYLLSYWQKNSSVWTYQSATINLNSSTTTYSISLTGQVDEIRFCPVGALMTTYTYTPGLGITSVTDPNSQTTYYEYDAMGRLWLVKDHNKKIIKEHKYNYRNNQ